MKNIPFILPLMGGLTCWAIIITLILACTGCGTDIPIPRVTIRGNYADYSYSAKSGIHIAPRISLSSRIIIEK